ncbi:glycosyltransferase family 2 protein [Salinimicrobium flavum]|uniref:Glycosyltransferase family 2 protein n=1 Tax=Salinimicrobium flavum TaxID=1737065 RepID=A0ABW5IYC8_9FLAO
MLSDVYVIIVAYNATQWLEECLQSVSKYQVIVVDNNSSDGTKDLIKKNFPQVNLIEQSENLGFGRANNIGLSRALSSGAKHLFLLNQDAWILEGCVDNLVDLQKKNPQYGVLSPVHLNAKKDKMDVMFSKHISFEYNPYFLSDLVLKKEQKDLYDFPFINAAAWLISRECIETVGGFDPIFFHYGEDINYCSRVRYHGFKIGLSVDNYIVHDRETRKHNLENFTKAYLDYKERNYKVRFASITTPISDELKRKLAELKKDILKNILFLRWKEAHFYFTELTMIRRIIPEIIKSRELNMRKGKHYIN